MLSVSGEARVQVESMPATGIESISVPAGTNVMVGHDEGSRIAMPTESTTPTPAPLPVRDSFLPHATIASSTSEDARARRLKA